MKVNNNEPRKRQLSERQARRQEKAAKVHKAFEESSNVEVIPATSELHPEEEKVLRVAAYCRVSTDQDTQTMSYTLQVESYQKHIKGHPNWEYVDVYADVDAPYGQNANRP